jgi:hypothetical protein
MEEEDSFFARLQPIEKLPLLLDRRNRFARDEKKSAKTLGFILVLYNINIHLKDPPMPTPSFHFQVGMAIGQNFVAGKVVNSYH